MDKKKTISIVLVVVAILVLIPIMKGLFISRSAYDSVVGERNTLISERDALQTELSTANTEIEELRKSNVTLDEYNELINERDELQALVSDYDDVIIERDELIEKLSQYEEVDNTESNEEIEDTNNNSKEDAVTDTINITQSFGPVSYFGTPEYVANADGCFWTIESFEITSLELSPSGDYYYIDYTCTGQGDYGNIKFYCYDSDGYQVDSFLVPVTTNSSEVKFKVEDNRPISSDTVRIDIE